MRRLLSTKDLRAYSVLTYMLDNNESTLSNLSDTTGIPLRSLQSIINRLNEIIAPGSIITHTNGISLHDEPETSKRFYYQKILSYSFEFQLLESIFLQPEQSVANLAEAFFVSDATIRRTIHTLNKELKSHDIAIDLGTMSLQGSERSISLFFVAYFSERYSFLEDFIDPLQITAINILTKNMGDVELKLTTTQDINHLKIWLFVRITLSQLIHPKQIYQAFEIIENEAIQTQFQMAFNMPLSDEIINFCFEFLLINRFSFSLEQATLQAAESAEDARLLKNLETLIDEILSNDKVSIKNREYMIINIFNIVRMTYSPTFILYDRNLDFLEHLKKTEAKIYTQVDAMFDEIFEDSLSLVQKHEILYIILSHWSGLLDSLHQQITTVNVAICVDRDYELATLIYKDILSSFPYGVSVEIIDAFSKNQLMNDLNRYQILITTIPGITHTTCKTLCINGYPSYQDWVFFQEIVTYVRASVTHL